MKIIQTHLFTDFFESEKTSGVLLMLCTIASIAIANSDFGAIYLNFWHTKVVIGIGETFSMTHSLEQWVNDGLMAIFFMLIGLEIEREVYTGELSQPKNASLPIIAALGGMIIPALLHFLLNAGTATQSGAGIPMATDIAFALGILALLGNRVPVSLKVFLAALAIIDDLGAILVIALFYQTNFSLVYFALAAVIFAVLLAFNRLGINKLSAYLIPGFALWYCMQQSGVHATIAGVLLAFAIPFRNGDESSPSFRLQHILHKPVAFLIMPVFALANTGIELSGDWISGLATSNSLGILIGLCAGKPLGVVLFSLAAVKLGISQLPEDVQWNQIIGAGFLAGIGFTMSIFITLLAFDSPGIVNSSKISILFSSALAGSAGFLILSRKPAHRSDQRR